MAIARSNNANNSSSSNSLQREQWSRFAPAYVCCRKALPANRLSQHAELIKQHTARLAQTARIRASATSRLSLRMDLPRYFAGIWRYLRQPAIMKAAGHLTARRTYAFGRATRGSTGLVRGQLTSSSAQIWGPFDGARAEHPPRSGRSLAEGRPRAARAGPIIIIATRDFSIASGF